MGCVCTCAYIRTFEWSTLSRERGGALFVSHSLDIFNASNTLNTPRSLVNLQQDVALFKEGLPANDAIKLMAEDGDNSALLVSLRQDLFLKCYR